MKGERALKAMFSDPRMKELIDSLWREYPGLYNERYNNQVGSVPELVEGIEPWKSNTFSPDIEFGQAVGQDHSINGNQSTAIGIGAITRSFREMILGSYAKETAAFSTDTWDLLDLLFVLGNGVDPNNRSNVIEIFKSGLVKLFNGLKLSQYSHGEEVPEDGILQFLNKKFQISIDGVFQDIITKQVSEVLSGSVDGINKQFSTSKQFISGSVIVFRNGLKETEFTEIDNTTIRMDQAPMNVGFIDKVEVIYSLKF